MWIEPATSCSRSQVRRPTTAPPHHAAFYPFKVTHAWKKWFIQQHANTLQRLVLCFFSVCSVVSALRRNHDRLRTEYRIHVDCSLCIMRMVLYGRHRPCMLRPWPSYPCFGTCFDNQCSTVIRNRPMSYMDVCQHMCNWSNSSDR